MKSSALHAEPHTWRAGHRSSRRTTHISPLQLPVDPSLIWNSASGSLPPCSCLFFVIKGWGWGKVTVGSVSNQIEMQRDHYLGREEKICCRRESRPQASTSPSLLLLQRELCSLTDDELGAGQGVMKHHQIELSAGSLEREMTAKAAKNQFFRIVFFLAPFTALPSQQSDQGYLMRGGRGKPGVYKMDSQVGA